MLRSNLCDYNDACILVSAIIVVPNTAVAGSAANNNN